MFYRIRLIHWNVTEAEERAVKLRAAGFEVDSTPLDATSLRTLRENPPDAVVIDLNRAPSQGRDLGLIIRKHKSTRHVPLVFVNGDPEKVARIKNLLPDAVYTTWGRIRSSLKRAIARVPVKPVVPKSTLNGYVGTPLPKKLGIKANSVIALVGAPKGFEKILGDIPDGVVIHRGARGRCDLALWFIKSRKELESRIERMSAFAGKDGLWIIWPKKTSGLNTDLSQGIVRKVGLTSGLVDYKVCAIDVTWSGLKFAQRKSRF